MTSSLTATNNGPIFFWREFEEPYGYLSQWYTSAFTAPPPPSAGQSADEMTFLTTEQYMMYHKAVVFNDHEIANKIILEPSPRKQKELGRKVKGFDNKIWNAERERVVEEGNYFKFTRSKEGGMEQMLLSTGNRLLVECSEYDRIWGIGFTAANAEANKADWGQNLLGKALMNVRQRLQTQSKSNGN